MVPPPKRPIKVVLKSSSSSGNASTTASTTATSASRLDSEVEATSDLDLSISASEESNDYDSDDDLEEQSEIQSSPRRMTARQRALHEQDMAAVEDVEPTTFATPAQTTGRKQVKRQLTEEEQLLESEKQRKRKHLRDQKLEDSKRAIVERLLQKQSTRSKKSQKTIQSIDQQHQQNASLQTGEEVKAEDIVALDSNTEKYISRRDGEYFVTASNITIADTNQKQAAVKCSVKGCANSKKCSYQNKPICGSLECYRKLCK